VISSLERGYVGGYVEKIERGTYLEVEGNVP
jgi:hypothetical protein